MARLSNVNSVDIRDAVRLGCGTMARAFNRHDADRPFFSAFAWPSARLGWSGHYSDAHVPGRHLNALVAARKILGIEIDEEALRKHAAALYFSYSGEIPLPLNRASVRASRPEVFLAHNLREGFHGLNALIWDREDERAFELVRRSIDYIQKRWHPRNGWSFPEAPSGFIPNHLVSGIGRAIGPLVKIYSNTHYRPALELAQTIAAAAPAFYPDDGRYQGDRLGAHVHSITSTMSSLAQLAEVTDDAALLRRVAAFHDNGLWQLRDDIGWAIETTRPDANPDRGEVNTSGDIMETALILGVRLDSAYFGDAERILRCHVLPSQLRDLALPDEAQLSRRQSVLARLQGAWGFPAPYGHRPLGLPAVSFNLDIVGGTVGSLCEFYRRALSHDGEGGLTLHCLLDVDEPDLQIQTPYTGGRLTIHRERPGPLAVRVPNWFEGDPDEYARHNNLRHESGYWQRDMSDAGVPLELDLPLARESLVLRHRTRDIRVNLAGDSVLAMDDHGADLSFFEDLDD